MTVLLCWSSRFWTSAIATVFLVLFGCSPAVIGSDRGRSGGDGAKCPADLAGETRLCLTEYTGQLDALLVSDNRFFPGLDVEVIRSLCSLLDDSMSCVSMTLIKNCPRSDQQQTIDDELSPHLGVRQLCIHTNIYEDYAMNQNCFVRIRLEAEHCYRQFMIDVQDDEPNERHSSSSLSSSQRHQQQQGQYCPHLRKLISCVKSLVRSSTTSCQKSAVRLVDVLIRASVPNTANCRNEPNPTANPAQGKTSERFHEARSSGRALQGRSLGGLLGLCCFAVASLVCLQSVYLRVLGPPSASLPLFHRPPPSVTTPPLSQSPPSPHRRLRLHHRRFADLQFS